MAETPEERLLLSLEGVTEHYENAREAVSGTLYLYLISIPGTDSIFLHATLPSGLGVALPAMTVINKTSETGFQIVGNEWTTVTVNLDLLDPESGSSASRDKEAAIDEAGNLEVIFTQFCSFAHPKERGSLVLIDEANGQEVGTLENMKLTEAPGLKYDKTPVEIVVDQKTQQAMVQPFTGESTEETPGVAMVQYDKNDAIISTASDFSKGLVFVSSKISSGMGSAASWWVSSRPAAETPTEVSETTKKNMKRANKVTATGAHYTHKAASAVADAAGNLGKKLAPSRSPRDKDDGKRGILSRSLIAFSTVMDGLDTSTQTLLNGSTTSTTKVITHSYGQEAGELAGDFGRSLGNCAMVYIDARGISRKAIVKGVGMGMVKGTFGHDNKLVLVDQSDSQPGTGPSAPTSSTPSPALSSTPSPAPSLPPRPPALPPRTPPIPPRPS